MTADVTPRERWGAGTPFAPEWLDEDELAEWLDTPMSPAETLATVAVFALARYRVTQERPCRWPLGHRYKHTCSCICAKPYGHAGWHRCAVQVSALTESRKP